MAINEIGRGANPFGSDRGPRTLPTADTLQSGGLHQPRDTLAADVYTVSSQFGMGWPA